MGQPVLTRPRGYRQGMVAPPKPRCPLANLTRSMSEPGQSPSEPASPPEPETEHAAEHAAAVSTPRHIQRRYVALGLIIVAICLLGALVLVRDNSGPSTSTTVETFNAAPSSLISSLASVPPSVFNTIGVSSPTNPVTPLHPARGDRLPVWKAATVGGGVRPVVFFYGAEFAPYPAVERWPLVLALSRFGTFKQLGLMQSSGTTAFAGLSTFTFWNVSYSSNDVVFQPVERYGSLNPTGARYLGLQRPDPRQAAAVSSNEGTKTFAFVDIGNRYVLSGASFAPAALAGLSQSQIAGYLTMPTSPLTQAVVTAANQISASICAVDGDRPGAVCQSRGVLNADRQLKIAPPS